VRRVVVESPYAGDVARNVAYARAAVRDSVLRGEAPVASHLLFTQPGILRDGVPEERALGITAGHAWIEVADLVAVYTDLGISIGMMEGIKKAEKLDILVVYRVLEEQKLELREMAE
jgi:hypothetical protein